MPKFKTQRVVSRAAGKRKLAIAKVPVRFGGLFKSLGSTSRKSGVVLGTNTTKGSLKGPFGAFDRMSPFPPHMNCKLTYTEDITLNTTNLSNVCGATYYMGVNCLYDPYLAAGGGQPYGFDQICSSTGPYYRYKVNGCMLKAVYTKPSTTDLKVCGAIHGPTGYSAGNTISGLLDAKIREKSNTWVGNLSTSGRRSAGFKQWIPMNILFEWDKAAYRADMTNSTGAYNGNPADVVAFETGCLDTSSGAQSNCLVTITLTYYCTFYDRAQLAAS